MEVGHSYFIALEDELLVALWSSHSEKPNWLDLVLSHVQGDISIHVISEQDAISLAESFVCTAWSEGDEYER